MYGREARRVVLRGEGDASLAGEGAVAGDGGGWEGRVGSEMILGERRCVWQGRERVTRRMMSSGCVCSDRLAIEDRSADPRALPGLG